MAASCSPPKGPLPIVIDHGSQTTRAGFAADRAPQVTIPTVVGRRGNEVFVGDEVKDKPDLLLEYPIVRGTITNWEAMIEIWKYIFKTLNASPDKHSVLLTEAACVTKADREKMTQIMFETFNATSIYLADQAILSLYATGYTEGFVLSSGYGVTQLVPCHQGNLVAEANARLDLAGSDMTEYLMKLLTERGIQSVSTDTARSIKETLCYVALNFDQEVPGDKSYKLPGGQEITVNTERTCCPEYFFKPENNVVQMMKDSITKCSEKTGMDLNILYSSIVISGGNTLFPGMVERVQKELQAMAPAGIVVKVISAGGGINSTFIGGSILTCLEQFQAMWITKQDYDTNGPAIVHTKCV